MSPDPRIHPAAATGFERSVEDYERGRPDFPMAAVDFLVERLRLGPGRTLLELGPGTGKLTRLLAPTRARIVAIEPVAAMREALARNAPAAEVLDAVAEELPVEDESIDAAVAAQAFHWFDGPRALDELGRVLRGGGRLGLVWNVRDESVPWIGELTDLIEPYRGDTPSHRALRLEGRLRIDARLRGSRGDVVPLRPRDDARRNRGTDPVDQLHRGAPGRGEAPGRRRGEADRPR
jgi:SAM-dependent methyltransferase